MIRVYKSACYYPDLMNYATLFLSSVIPDFDLGALEGDDLMGDYDTADDLGFPAEDMPEDGQVADPYYYSDYDYRLLTDEVEKGGETMPEPFSGGESDSAEEKVGTGEKVESEEKTRDEL